MKHADGSARRGVDPTPKVSRKVFDAIAEAVDRAVRTGRVPKGALAERVCGKCTLKDAKGRRHEMLSCRHDHFTFRGRPWLWRSLTGHAKGRPYMNHRHAHCILWRAEALKAFDTGEIHRLKILVGQDEPLPNPSTLAVYPGAAPAVAADLVEVVRRTLPAIALRGKKHRDIEMAFEEYFKAREVDDHLSWQAYFAGTSVPPKRLKSRTLRGRKQRAARDAR